MSVHVIALSGYKGSGKDTVADYLVAEHGYIKKQFASRLKDLVSDMYGVPRYVLDDPAMKEMPLHNLPAIPTDQFTGVIHRLLSSELSSGFWTPRALCILEGSTRRSVHSNYWTTTVVNDILQASSSKYVISDVRYKSEVDTLRMLIPGIRILRVTRPGNDPSTRDPSERDLDTYTGFDGIVENSGTREELHERINRMLGIVPDPTYWSLRTHTR